eukprot:m.213054 g.213054  ORF g.213054 m.213054 type:complete len:53 (-) comp33137_c14_seq1:414-572(-)
MSNSSKLPVPTVCDEHPFVYVQNTANVNVYNIDGLPRISSVSSTQSPNFDSA